jgi:hypothetical protein
VVTPPPPSAPRLPPILTPEDKDAIKKLLNEAITKGDSHPFVIDCSATSFTCTPPAVFISAANISGIRIKDIPATTRKLTVRIDAGETDGNGKSLIVRRVYDPSAIPDHLLIAVSRARRIRETYSAKNITQGSAHTTETKLTVDSNDTPAHAYLRTQSNIDENGEPQSLSDDPAIGFVALGKSETMIISLQFNDDEPRAMDVSLNYQRWFIDMGGFLTFGFVSDQELATEDAATGQVLVTKKRSKDKFVPGTGIVLNFHPANYPALAAQFGIATSVDRAASYYFGAGYRLRELGPKTLATFAFGIAATQVQRFPDVKVGDIRSATSTSITQGTKRYAFGPYFSLSLGFSFGGVDPPQQPAPQ